METAQAIAPDMDFGTRLQVARRRTGLDLRAVAAQVPGVSMSALAKWERNEREPGAFRLARLAEFYDVDLRWLLDGSTTLSDRGPTTRYLLSIVPPVTGQLHLDFAPDATDPTRSVELLAAVA